MDSDAGGASLERAAAFSEVFRENFDDVLRFCVRRVPPGRAEDIAAEAMTIAWRRFEELPAAASDRRAWLYTTARNLILRDHRDRMRRHALTATATPMQTIEIPGFDAHAHTRIDLGRAWRLLSAAHQEALALTAWDGLTSVEAAKVLGISPVAYRLRLSRARRVLRAHLGISTEEEPDGTRPSPFHPSPNPEATS